MYTRRGLVLSAFLLCPYRLYHTFQSAMSPLGRNIQKLDHYLWHASDIAQSLPDKLRPNSNFLLQKVILYLDVKALLNRVKTTQIDTPQEILFLWERAWREFILVQMPPKPVNRRTRS